MSWVWLNLPLGGVIFLAIAGIPLWMVIKRPDRGPSYGTVPAGPPATQVRARGAAAGRVQTGAEPVPEPVPEAEPARWNRKPVRVPQIADRPVTVPRPRPARIPAWNPSAGR